jgi:hypothetical protein
MAITLAPIDGTYPVAGQDNDSQGFRDNFTNTKTNFDRCAAAITDLQSKAVLKAQLTGVTGQPTNNMNGLPLRNLQLQEFYLTASAELENGAVASNTVTVNYFTTGGAEIATLGTGQQDGQVKIFCATDVSAGDMVITVTNAAWGGAGIITFDSNGQGCTLLWTNSRWFCIGNNGATFA